MKQHGHMVKDGHMIKAVRRDASLSRVWRARLHGLGEPLTGVCGQQLCTAQRGKWNVTLVA